ncbi:MAG: phosphoribosyltransferase family protein [Coriobacteriia bacterium]|nr:phosphoribosyltransferase family protein [Coriobacteriia bacterium]
MNDTVDIEVAGIKTKFELFPVSDDTQIAAFIMYKHIDITEAAARELLKRVPEFDAIVTAEAKGIALAQEMAKQAGLNSYVVARKSTKVYMQNCISTNVDSITTEGIQTLYLGESDYKPLEGKRVIIVDDVISTGGSIKSLEVLMSHIKDCEVVAKCFVFAEGEAANRDDVIYLEKLHLYDSHGNIKN